MPSNLDWKKAASKAAREHSWPIPSDFDLKRNILGPATRELFLTIKEHAGIKPKDDRLDDHLQHYLHQYLPPQPKPPRKTAREKLVDELRWGISHNYMIGYAEVRPIPIHAWKDHQALVTDCSGSYTAACYAAGLPDPNGLHYDGQGYTETLLNHMREVNRHTAQAGDAVIFGHPSVHVCALLEDCGTIYDPLVFNHGHSGPPDEPSSMRLSYILDYFSGYPVTYCSPT